jgi:hypothetical protein
MTPGLSLDNNRLSHWLLSITLGWVIVFVVLGLLFFHFLLGVTLTKIAIFIMACWALQLAVTPWLFWARATETNPTGRAAHRYAAIIILGSAITLLFFLCLRWSSPQDAETRLFTSIGIGLTILFSVVGLIRYCAMPRRSKWFSG